MEDAYQPSFLLLPDQSHFIDDENVKLGRVLEASDGAPAIPDPDLPYDVSIDVPKPKTQNYQPWEWDSDQTTTVSAGVWADWAVAMNAGLKFEAGRTKTTGLGIKCDRVEQHIFKPSSADIEKVRADRVVKKVLEKRSHPPVYLITGIMIAHGAHITIRREAKRGVEAHAGVLEPTMQISAGLKGEISKSQNSSQTLEPEKPFILAYQLLRLKKKLFGKDSKGLANERALFNGIEGDAEEESEDEIQLDLFKPEDFADELREVDEEV